MTRRFYEAHRQDRNFSAAVSAILLPQSYVSLEFVLQQNNLLTEVTYPITCITRRNTRTITNDIGVFRYRNIRAELYRNFTIQEYLGIRYGCASLAKALFDFLYLRPIPASYRSKHYDLAEELRLNLDEVDDATQVEFAELVALSDSPKMADILANFRSNGWLP
ncbi:MAG: hypothetical protein DYG89_52420 [Caldilinea sp. CFX5]|nr:hypothetical protein [Caldilinea sp. CFX5]